MMKALFFVRLTPPMGADLARKLEMTPVVEVGSSVWSAWRQGDVVLFQAYGKEDWRSRGTVIAFGSPAKAADLLGVAVGLVELEEVYFGGLSSERSERYRQSEAPAIPSPERDCCGPNYMFFGFQEGPQIKRCCCVHDDGTVDQYSMVLGDSGWRVTERLSISGEACVRRSTGCPASRCYGPFPPIPTSGQSPLHHPRPTRFRTRSRAVSVLQPDRTILRILFGCTGSPAAVTKPSPAKMAAMIR